MVHSLLLLLLLQLLRQVLLGLGYTVRSSYNNPVRRRWLILLLLMQLLMLLLMMMIMFMLLPMLMMILLLLHFLFMLLLMPLLLLLLKEVKERLKVILRDVLLLENPAAVSQFRNHYSLSFLLATFLLLGGSMFQHVAV
jgi:hypothetical protein